MGGTRGGTRRVTQREAAEILGVSVEAIRKRIRRGTLTSEKGEDGRRYVYLDTGPDEDQPKAEGETSVPSGPLVEDLRDQVRYLRDQLREERRANDENRRLLAAALERIPALEPPPSASPSTEPESPQESPEEPGP